MLTKVEEKNLAGKKLAVKLTGICLVLLAVGLLIFIRHIFKESGLPTHKEEGISLIPFDIGFRWETLLGMFAVILIQMAMYALMHCKREWKLLVWTIGTTFFHVAGFNDFFAGSSRLYLEFELRERGIETGIGFADVWERIRIGTFVGIAVLCLYLFFWMLRTKFDFKREKYAKRNAVISCVTIPVNIALLVLTSYTNPWYLLLCLLFGFIGWLVLCVEEKAWSRLGLDKLPFFFEDELDELDEIDFELDE
ncbi:MAG: hypothetical protein ACI4FY_02825 [Acetatifactor sp.]